MKVLFVHENTLGHGSYLPAFVNYFNAHPSLGVEAELFNATPLPPDLEAKANFTVRGLRRFGLDNHFARWRQVVSAHVHEAVEARLGEFEAVVVNTQSVGLDLADCRRRLFVACDATFRQLCEGRWFSDPPLGKVGAAISAGIIEKERALFRAATAVLSWSQTAARSVVEDYGVPSVVVLPPSVAIPPERAAGVHVKPRALFVGGDFKRKGGDLLLEVYEQQFRDRIELDIVTQSSVTAPNGVRIWRDVRAGSEEWNRLWREADLFIFPSRLETFGIVLVEALAFGVPIIASRAGAAAEILQDGAAGLLLDRVDAASLNAAVNEALANPGAALERARLGFERAKAEYDISKNARRLATLLRPQ
jgi:glycosyltransferase involved in cell wall biosynthesis